MVFFGSKAQVMRKKPHFSLHVEFLLVKLKKLCPECCLSYRPPCKHCYGAPNPWPCPTVKTGSYL